MKIELGKTYTTREGRKARVICVDLKSNQPIIALHEEDDGEASRCHESNGRWLYNAESRHDLISEWVDKPVFDPATFPKWRWAAISANGTAWLYENKPLLRGSWWSGDYGRAVEIQPPPYQGDWKDSLVELP